MSGLIPLGSQDAGACEGGVCAVPGFELAAEPVSEEPAQA